MADTQRKRLHRCGCRGCQSRRDSELVAYHRAINRVMAEPDELKTRIVVEPWMLAGRFIRLPLVVAGWPVEPRVADDPVPRHGVSPFCWRRFIRSHPLG
jgi:hypothetical protein